MPPPRQRQKNKAAASTPAKVSKPDRFTALLTCVRHSLGNQWTLYEECIEGILEAAAKNQDTTAWFEQLQRLVGGNDKVQFSHEGVIYLLRDMGIRPSVQQSQVEGVRHGRKYLSLPLSPPQANFIGSALPSTAEKYFSHARSTSNMSVQGQPSNSTQGPPSSFIQGQTSTSEHGQMSNSRQGQTDMPVLAQWPVTQAPIRNFVLQQKVEKQLLKLRTQRVPFDFSARSILPELTYPRDLQTFFYPPDEIVLDSYRRVSRFCASKPRSRKTIFFEDPTMAEKIYHMFGYTARWRHGTPDGSDDKYIREIDRLPYDPEGDDLEAWAVKLEDSTEGEDDQMEASDHITQWPPWKKRYDLEL
jgi:hypothetical protein